MLQSWLDAVSEPAERAAVKIAGEPGFDRRTSADWVTDDWDDVGEVPAVEPLPRQSRLVKWTVWGVMVVVIAMVLIAGWVGWWYLERVKPEGESRNRSHSPCSPATPSTRSPPGSKGRASSRGVGVHVVRRPQRWLGDRARLLPVAPGDHMGNVLGRCARLRTRRSARSPSRRASRSSRWPTGWRRSSRGWPAAFVAAANSADRELRYRPPGVTSLEGLLFPDTYQVSNRENEAQVIERMVTLMERVGRQEDLDTGRRSSAGRRTRS